jgi:NAD(P)-dependent dehydrogenase (short-subunit alcohol dehydrogenase family)
MENRESVIFVTGASSGIGNACATFFAKKGTRIYGTCRNPSSYTLKADEFFEMLPMDLSDDSSIAKAAEKVLAKEGRVDALVCCAGSGLVGAVEDIDLDEAQAAMDVNFFGTLRTIKAFLPSMREAGKGRIVIVGAIEGLVASPYQPIFSAAEFALEGLAQSLRMEVSRFGIEVGVIELASFRTAFGQRRRIAAAASETSAYRTGFENALGVVERDEVAGFDPLIASRAIYAMLNARRMPIRKTAGRLSRRILAHSRRWLGTRAIERRLRGYYRLD